MHPLVWSAQSGHCELVTVVLGESAELAQVAGGFTALSAAADTGKGHWEVVDQLLQAGADFDQATFLRGCSPLYALE